MIEDSIQVVAIAFNEEGTIQKVLERTHEVLRKNCRSFEIIAYDDGSTDSTGAICDRFAAAHDRTRVIHNSSNRGIGYLLKASYLGGTHDWTVIICSDMQFDPFDLELFFPHLRDNDIVISCRKDRQDAFLRKYISSADKLLLKALFGASFKDLHWIKFVNLKYIDKANIMAESPFVETEILLRAKKKGARIKEILVPHYPRVHGVAKGASLKNIMNSVRDLFLLYLKI